MIAIGCAITRDDVYESCALPGIELAREADTELIALRILRLRLPELQPPPEEARKLARERDDFEGVVIVHQDAEIVDPDFLPKVREAFSDPEVALVGCAGALDVRSIAWWEGSVTWASFTHRFEEYGGGEIPALTWYPEKVPVYAETGEVDAIDGFVIGFSPWAVENLRFDESIGGALHGYDFDICMQARSAGKKVVTSDLHVVHHHSLVLISGIDAWIDAHIKLAEKWHEHLPVTSLDWRRRARLAEAEVSAVRLAHGSGELIWERRMEVVEDELDRIKNSLSWRVTRPLRMIARLMRGGKPKGVKVAEPQALPPRLVGANGRHQSSVGRNRRGPLALCPCARATRTWSSATSCAHCRPASPGSARPWPPMRGSPLANAANDASSEPAWISSCSVVRLCWVSDAFAAHLLYRLRTTLKRRRVPLLPAILHRFSMILSQVAIGDPVLMHPGVYLMHGQVVLDGIIEIGPGAVIGPWVTIGLRAENVLGPSLDQDVTVGTGAKIIGPLTVGAGANIGAGAIVVGDVEPGSTVVGSPARAVR